MKIFKLILILLLFSSCSLVNEPVAKPSRLEEARKRQIENQAVDVQIEDSVIEEGYPTTSRNSEAGQTLQFPTEYGIELSWDIPADPVDSFIINWGSTEDILDSELELRIDELKSTADGRYLYVIRPVDPDKSIFVAIAAKRGTEISEKSRPQEFAPNPEFSDVSQTKRH